MEVKVEQLTPGLTLGEGPHWVPETQSLYFVDILGQTIHKYTPADNNHTYSKVEGRVGFITPVAGSDREFVVGIEREVVVVEWDGRQDSPVTRKRLLATLESAQPTRINDAKADPRGRLFAGTMGRELSPGKYEQGAGTLYRVPGDGSRPRPVLQGLGIANGLDWDLSEKAFYYIDSLDYAVSKFNYDVETGDISDKRVLFDLKANKIPGFPDGQTLDSAGNLWVANFNGSQVLNIDTRSGALIRKIHIPSLEVTSVAWGGERLSDLYVTTANLSGTQPAPAGALFRVTGLAVTGRPMHPVVLH